MLNNKFRILKFSLGYVTRSLDICFASCVFSSRFDFMVDLVVEFDSFFRDILVETAGDQSKNPSHIFANRIVQLNMSIILLNGKIDRVLDLLIFFRF